MPSHADIVEAFALTGLTVRGGFLDGTATIILIGQVGGSAWDAFSAAGLDEPDPMDRWTERVVRPIANALGARAVFPNDRPYQPFQQWAARAEPVHPSPLGLLIHPDFGLWHAYRAALIFECLVDGLPDRAERPSPCDTCVEKPCLSACPVGAFTGTHYEVDVCAGHLRSRKEPDCIALGCRARDACPVGTEYRYSEPQIQFHMVAFAKARGV